MQSAGLFPVGDFTNDMHAGKSPTDKTKGIKMLEIILQLIILTSTIILIVMGSKDKDEHGKRTKAGITMMAIGIILLVCFALLGIPDFIEGFKEGLTD